MKKPFPSAAVFPLTLKHSRGSGSRLTLHNTPVARLKLWLVLAGLAIGAAGATDQRRERYLEAVELTRAGDPRGDERLRELAAQGYRPAAFELYLAAAAEPSTAESANDWLWRAGGPGRSAGRFELAERLLHGRGVAQDSAAAAFWFHLAAEQGHAGARIMLAGLLERGDGVAADPHQSEAWLRAAAETGSAEAQYRLGLRLDEFRGKVMIERAAQAGHVQAQRYLGVQLAAGGRYPTDEGAAVTWIEAAARAGDGLAQHLAGLFHLQGRGVERNPAQAYYWLKRAHLSGQAEAGARLAALEAELSLEQRVTATVAAVGEALPDPVPLNAHRVVPMATQMIGHGAGFWISGSGHLMTNAHVVQLCAEVRATGTGRLTLVAAEPDNDVAILIAEEPRTGPWVKLESASPSLNQVLTVVTREHAGTAYETLVSAAGRVTALERPGSDRRYFSADARLEQGASGAPMFDDAGQVRGVVVAKLSPGAAYRETGVAGESVTFALQPVLLAAFAELYGIDLDGGRPGAHEAVARVECWF